MFFRCEVTKPGCKDLIDSRSFNNFNELYDYMMSYDDGYFLRVLTKYDTFIFSRVWNQTYYNSKDDIELMDYRDLKALLI